MKKLLFFTIIVILVIVFTVPFLPAQLIRIHSNVPITVQDVFSKKGNFYYVYHSKLPVKIRRKFLYIDVFYNENILGVIQFTDGKFAITEKGHIIKLDADNGKFNLLADMWSKQWDSEFVSLFETAEKGGIINNINKFVVFNRLPAFYDKNNIVVIMGNGNYGEKFVEYKRMMKLFEKEAVNIKEIHMEFNSQAVIDWRKK